MEKPSRILFPLACLALGGAGALLVASSPVRAGGAEPGPARCFEYYPSGAGGTPELLDTRTGAIFKRNDTSSRWDQIVKPVGQD